jgi:PadR family transcriptional regulator PadR
MLDYMADKLDVLQGTLDLLILRTLQWGPQHGHGIGQVIRARSGDRFQVEHGSLYPAFTGCGAKVGSNRSGA